MKEIEQKINLDIRYATSDNFIKQKLYESAKGYLRKVTAQKLSNVQEELEKSGYGLKVYDAYRPLSVQKLMWEILPDDNYVASPSTGSRHNRGASVDVTIITKEGIELDMGTEYDDFSEKSHRSFYDLPQIVIDNRLFLENIMVKHGFISCRTEWWHFDDINWEKYDVLDKNFSELGMK